MPDMAIELGTAYISILPSTSKLAPELTKSLKGVEGKVGGEKSGQGIGSRLASGVGSALKKGAIGAGLAAGGLLGTALTKGFGRLNAIDQATAKLRGLGHNAKSVDKIMSNALASVKGTAFGLDEAATTAGAVVAAGIKPGKQLEGVLKTVADTATIAGTSMSDMGTIFGSVAARGKLQGDDMMQLTSRGVPVLAFLAKHYGITAKAASQMVSDGKVDFKNFAAAMKENIGGAAKDSGKTVSGAWKNMWASISRIGANLLSGIFPKLQKAFTGITDWLGPVEDKAKAFGQKVGSGIKIAADSVKTFVNAFRGKGDVGGKFMVPMVEAGVKARAIFDRLKGAASAAFGYLTKNVLPVVVSGFKGLWGAAQPIGPALVRIGKALAPIFQSSGKSAKDSGPGILAAAFSLLRVAVKGLAAILSGVADFAENHGTAFRRMAVAVTAGVAAWRAYVAVSKAVKGVILGYRTAAAGAAVVTQLQTKWTKLGTAAQKAFAVASRAAGIALRFMSGPIGWVITGLTLLGAGLVLLFKRNKTFHDLVISVWNGVKATVSAVVKWFTGSALPWMKGVFQGIGDKAGWLWKNVLKPTFNSIKQAFGWVGEKFSSVWNKVLKPLFTQLTKAWLDVVGGILHGAAKAFGWVPGLGPKLKGAAKKFDSFRDNVNKALNGIKNKHVDIVTAYKIKGPAANQQAAKLAGMGYASGGYTGDGGKYEPAGVVHRGEYVFTKEETARAGASNLAALASHLRGYANGGPVDFSIRTRGLNATRAHFESLAEDVNGLMGRLASGVKSTLMGVVSRLGLGGGHMSGSWHQLWDLVRPWGAILTSSVRPGARTQFGNLSRHAMGKAIDIGVNKAIFQRLYAMRGRFYELLTPWGMWLKGQPYYNAGVQAIHRNHMHISTYDQGGILPPGYTLAYNGTGKNETIRTHEQERSLLPREVALVVDGHQFRAYLTDVTDQRYRHNRSRELNRAV